ncbi:penicillin acylase family protein [bacterium]|nr:penicillin acylase family protein [bacterium]
MRALATIFVLLIGGAELVQAGEGKSTLYRDVWGVPHIYANTPAEGAYGLGYAMAEDRLDDVFQAIRTGLGRMAEIAGEDLVDQDYIMRICRNEEVCKKAWPDTPKHLQEIAIAFQAGIEAYMAEHPDKVPASKIDKLEPWMFNTVGRAMILRWPLGTIQDDLGNRPSATSAAGETSPAKEKDSVPKPAAEPKASEQKKETNIPMRSNEWAVSKARSAANGPILHADPHLTWEGLAVLYEARIHAGEWNVCGFFLIGSPIMGYGHNAQVGWANTTGGPDTADVYQMKIKPGIVPQYEYDGKWRTPKVVGQRIMVKGKEKPIIRPSGFSHLGPVISPIEGDVAFVGVSPYFDKTKLFDQFYLMNTSKDLPAFIQSLGMLEYNEQNVMFADTAGSIGYVRNGAVPIRPEGYNWSAPVPGHTSATAHQGVHPVEDLVQVVNPPSGYMQNCNISPAMMWKGSTLTRDRFKPYIFNVNDWERNPRGDRSTELLDADASVTLEDAQKFAMDVYDLKGPLWVKALQGAVDSGKVPRGKDAGWDAAVNAVLAWDGRWLADAKQTVLIRQWRELGAHQPDFAPMAAGEKLSPEAQVKLVDMLRQAYEQVTKTYGQWDIPYGKAFVIGRGGKYFPMNGADFGDRKDEYNYTETLLSISYQPDASQPGRNIAYKGSMAMILMLFHPDGVESYTATAWGQSGDPASPHYVDQSEKLFSQRKLKPTFWKKEDLLKNLESTKELSVNVSAASAPPSSPTQKDE